MLPALKTDLTRPGVSCRCSVVTELIVVVLLGDRVVMRSELAPLVVRGLVVVVASVVMVVTYAR